MARYGLSKRASQAPCGVPLVPSQEAKSFQPTITKVVAATHDTSYQNDAGGIKSSSRWLSEATPSGFVSVKRLAPRPGCKSFFASCSGGVVACAPQPPASGCDASGIHFMSQVSLIGGFLPHVFLRQSGCMTHPSANDAGGITECSRWLSEATPSGFVSVKLLAPRQGCKTLCRVVVRWCRR